MKHLIIFLTILLLAFFYVGSSNGEDYDQIKERTRILKHLNCLVCINTERKIGKTIGLTQDLCKFTCKKPQLFYAEDYLNNLSDMKRAFGFRVSRYRTCVNCVKRMVENGFNLSAARDTCQCADIVQRNIENNSDDEQLDKRINHREKQRIG